MVDLALHQNIVGTFFDLLLLNIILVSLIRIRLHLHNLPIVWAVLSLPAFYWNGNLASLSLYTPRPSWFPSLQSPPTGAVSLLKAPCTAPSALSLSLACPPQPAVQMRQMYNRHLRLSYHSERNEINKLSLTAASSTPPTDRRWLHYVSPDTVLSEQKRQAVL